MALTTTEKVRLRIGDKPPSPFYPLLTDEEIADILEAVNNDLNLATMQSAWSAALVLAQMPKREYYSDLAEVETDGAKYYLNVLKQIASNPLYTLPSSFTPYAAGISVADLTASMNDPDNPRRNSFLYNSGEEGCS